MGTDDQLALMLQNIPNSRQNHTDADIVSNQSLLIHGDIKINSDQYAFTGKLQFTNRLHHLTPSL
jgi:hypothetical protein